MRCVSLKKNVYFVIAMLVLLVSTVFVAPSQSEALSGNEPTYTYWMQKGNKTYKSTSYSKWKSQKGTVVGAATMKKKYSTKSGWSVTASAGIPVKAIEIGLEGNLTKESTLSTTISKKIPKGKTGVFQIRNQYKTYNVKMEQWFSMDGRKSKTGKVKIVTVKKKTDIQGRIILK